MNYLRINNPLAREKLIHILDNKHILDSYRAIHPETKRYTWRKKNPPKQARLDYIFVSESLRPTLKSCDISPSYRSDHSPVILTLKLNGFKRGRGLYGNTITLCYMI